MERLVRVLALMLVLTPAVASGADEHTDRLNSAFATVQESRRADLVLLPVLAAMDEPPVVLAGRADRVLLVTPSSPSWAQASAWASAEPQRAALKALAAITEEEHPRRAMAFALPYGVRGIPTDLVRRGMHAELGDPPTIAAAQLGYLERLGWLEKLAHIEATRLAADGEPGAALEVVFDLALLGRTLADRALFEEVAWGLGTMRVAMLRLRDIAYVDAEGAQTLEGSSLTSIVERIDMSRGQFRLDRVRMPMGDRVAAEQMVSRVFSSSGRPDESVFPTAMAELAATDRPLRLFAESGRWSSASSRHGNRGETSRAVAAVFDDWETRWTGNPFDRAFRSRTEYQQLDTQEFALVSQIVPDFAELFTLRREVEAELVGTRVALAVRALIIESRGGMPVGLSLVRPRYIDDLGVDPYNPDRAAGNRPELRFLVPERDTAGGRLHTMNVVPRGRTNFSATLGREQFVLYSLGGNEFDDRAINVSDDGLSRSGDFLIWPPVISLLRDYLEDQGASE